MAKCAHILARFPTSEFAIYRLYAQDPTFRGICDDYEEAVAALQHWGSDETRAGDFRRLALEIEAEIEAFLDDSRGDRTPSH